MLDKIPAKDLYLTGGLLCALILPQAIVSSSKEESSKHSFVGRILACFGFSLAKMKQEAKSLDSRVTYPVGMLSDNLVISCLAYSLLKSSNHPHLSQLSAKTIVPVGAALVTMSFFMDQARRLLAPQIAEPIKSLIEPSLEIKELQEEGFFPEVQFSTVITHPFGKSTFKPIPEAFKDRESLPQVQIDLVRTSSPVKSIRTLCKVSSYSSFIDQRSQKL